MRLPRKIIDRYFPNDEPSSRSRRRPLYNNTPLPFSEERVKYTFSHGEVTGYQVHPRMYGLNSAHKLNFNPKTQISRLAVPRRKKSKPKERHRVRESSRLNDDYWLDKYYNEVLRSFPNKTGGYVGSDPRCTESIEFAERLSKMIPQGHVSSPPSKKYYLLNEGVVGYEWTGEDIDSPDYCCIARQLLEPDIPRYLVVRTDIYFKLIGLNVIVTDFTFHPNGYTVPCSWHILNFVEEFPEDRWSIGRNKGLQRYYSEPAAVRNRNSCWVARIIKRTDEDKLVEAFTEYVTTFSLRKYDFILFSGIRKGYHLP